MCMMQPMKTGLKLFYMTVNYVGWHRKIVSFLAAHSRVCQKKDLQA